MTAKDIMTTDIVTIQPTAPLKEAIKLCVDHHISGLVVVNERGEIIGILTEKDLLVAFDFLGETESHIDEFVCRDVISVDEDTPLKELNRLVIQRNIKRVPVVKNKKAIGIVSRGDILKQLAHK